MPITQPTPDLPERPIAHRRTRAASPVPPPAGYRWHFARLPGRLQLIPIDAEADDLDIVYIRDAADRRKILRPYLPLSAPITKPSQLRRASRRLVREHYRRAIQEHRAALAAASVERAVRGLR